VVNLFLKTHNRLETSWFSC